MFRKIVGAALAAVMTLGFPVVAQAATTGAPSIVGGGFEAGGTASFAVVVPTDGVAPDPASANFTVTVNGNSLPVTPIGSFPQADSLSIAASVDLPADATGNADISADWVFDGDSGTVTGSFPITAGGPQEPVYSPSLSATDVVQGGTAGISLTTSMDPIADPATATFTVSFDGAAVDAGTVNTDTSTAGVLVQYVNVAVPADAGVMDVSASWTYGSQSNTEVLNSLVTPSGGGGGGGGGDTLALTGTEVFNQYFYNVAALETSDAGATVTWSGSPAETGTSSHNGTTIHYAVYGTIEGAGSVSISAEYTDGNGTQTVSKDYPVAVTPIFGAAPTVSGQTLLPVAVPALANNGQYNLVIDGIAGDALTGTAVDGATLPSTGYDYFKTLQAPVVDGSYYAVPSTVYALNGNLGLDAGDHTLKVVAQGFETAEASFNVEDLSDIGRRYSVSASGNVGLLPGQSFRYVGDFATFSVSKTDITADITEPTVDPLVVTRDGVVVSEVDSSSGSFVSGSLTTYYYTTTVRLENKGIYDFASALDGFPLSTTINAENDHAGYFEHSAIDRPAPTVTETSAGVFEVSGYLGYSDEATIDLLVDGSVVSTVAADTSYAAALARVGGAAVDTSSGSLVLNTLLGGASPVVSDVSLPAIAQVKFCYTGTDKCGDPKLVGADLQIGQPYNPPAATTDAYGRVRIPQEIYNYSYIGGVTYEDSGVPSVSAWPTEFPNGAPTPGAVDITADTVAYGIGQSAPGGEMWERFAQGQFGKKGPPGPAPGEGLGTLDWTHRCWGLGSLENDYEPMYGNDLIEYTDDTMALEDLCSRGRPYFSILWEPGDTSSFWPTVGAKPELQTFGYSNGKSIDVVADTRTQKGDSPRLFNAQFFVLADDLCRTCGKTRLDSAVVRMTATGGSGLDRKLGFSDAALAFNMFDTAYAPGQWEVVDNQNRVTEASYTNYNPGDTVTYAWSVYSNPFSYYELDIDGFDATFWASPAEQGRNGYYCEVGDGSGYNGIDRCRSEIWKGKELTPLDKGMTTRYTGLTYHTIYGDRPVMEYTFWAEIEIPSFGMKTDTSRNGYTPLTRDEQAVIVDSNAEMSLWDGFKVPGFGTSHTYKFGKYQVAASDPTPVDEDNTRYYLSGELPAEAGTSREVIWKINDQQVDIEMAAPAGIGGPYATPQTRSTGLLTNYDYTAMPATHREYVLQERSRLEAFHLANTTPKTKAIVENAFAQGDGRVGVSNRARALGGYITLPNGTYTVQACLADAPTQCTLKHTFGEGGVGILPPVPDPILEDQEVPEEETPEVPEEETPEVPEEETPEVETPETPEAPVAPGPALRLRSTPTAGTPVEVGSTITYKAIIANTGDDDAGPGPVKVTIPEGATFVSAEDGGQYREAKNIVVWKDISLKPGESRIFTYKVTTKDAVVQVSDATWLDLEDDVQHPPIVDTPKTGADQPWLVLIAGLVFLGAGVMFFRPTRVRNQ